MIVVANIPDKSPKKYHFNAVPMPLRLHSFTSSCSWEAEDCFSAVELIASP